MPYLQTLKMQLMRQHAGETVGGPVGDVQAQCYTERVVAGKEALILSRTFILSVFQRCMCCILP